jgi:ataxia telangiectasia mutated family protein
MAVTALSFESLLILNGMRLNRRVVQCACKLISAVTSLLTDSRWTVEEKALILLGLEPFTSTGDEEKGEGRWKAMLPPDNGTGIKTQTLRALISDKENRKHQVQALRREFQRIIWQSADVSVCLYAE